MNSIFTGAAAQLEYSSSGWHHCVQHSPHSIAKRPTERSVGERFVVVVSERFEGVAGHNMTLPLPISCFVRTLFNVDINTLLKLATQFECVEHHVGWGNPPMLYAIIGDPEAKMAVAVDHTDPYGLLGAFQSSPLRPLATAIVLVCEGRDHAHGSEPVRSAFATDGSGATAVVVRRRRSDELLSVLELPTGPLAEALREAFAEPTCIGRAGLR